MSIADLIIIIFLLIGTFIGYKQGFTRSLVNLAGYVIIVVIAFVFKDAVASFMMLRLPFFDFWGLVKGASVLAIAIYEVVSFGLIFSILMIVLKILMFTTKIFEKILSFTIVLGMPSKILGALVGVVNHFVIVFVLLYILTLPSFVDNEFINSSKFKTPILENTPLLSLFAHKSLAICDEFISLKEKYKETSSANEYNLEALDLFLKYDVISSDTVKTLIKRDRLHIKGADKILKKYEEEA